MSDRFEKQFPATIEAMTGCVAEAREFLGAIKPSPKSMYTADLAIEELTTNAIRYGYDDNPANHLIGLKIDAGDRYITVTIEDSGREFDPTRSKDPDVPRSIEETAVGGLGLKMIRKSAMRMDYKRRNGRNVVTILLPR